MGTATHHMELLEEFETSGDSLAAILDRAVAEANFETGPAHYADQQAEQTHALGRVICTETGDAAEMAGVATRWTGLPITAPSLHVRLFDSTGKRVALVVAHNFTTQLDAELVVCSTQGLPWTRTTVRGLARWLFDTLTLRRVTLRIPSSNLAARGYARRLGFKFEGLQRKWLNDEGDIYLFGMLRTECRWL